MDKTNALANLDLVHTNVLSFEHIFFSPFWPYVHTATFLSTKNELFKKRTRKWIPLKTPFVRCGVDDENREV